VKISEISVHRPVFATVISLLLVILGLVSLDRLPVREYPDMDSPIVSISTDYRGASAAIVEEKITQVIEDRIAGLEGIEKIRSSPRATSDPTSTSSSAPDRDIDAATNDIRDRVARVLEELPVEADPPEIAKTDADAEPVMWMAVASDRMSVLELTDYVERVLVDQVAASPGVARVQVGGSRRPAVRVWIDRQALAARQLTVVRHRERAADRERRAAGRAAWSRSSESSRCAPTPAAKVEDFRSW
jgi:multidrug efflux pump